MTEQPNIFEFATSELSQDAFLRYLFCFGKEEYKGSEEYTAAKDFLHLCGIDEDVIEVKKQYKHIDVLVMTKNNYLIIEDKTSSFEHDNQIQRYIEEIKKEIENMKDEPSEEKKITAVYFKTGFVSEQEKGWIKDSFKKIKNSNNDVKLYLMQLNKNNEKLILTSNLYLENKSIEETDKRSLELSICKDQIITQWYLRRYKECTEISKAKENAKNFWKSNSKELPQNFYDNIGVYLDTWAHEIDKNKYKDVRWFVSSGRTIHILLKEDELKDKDFDYRYGIYLIFNKNKYELTFKHHLYNKEGNRYLIKNYPSDSKEFLEKKRTLIENIISEYKSDWSYIKCAEGKEKLMVVKKEFEYDNTVNLYQVLENEKKFIYKLLEKVKGDNKKTK